MTLEDILMGVQVNVDQSVDPIDWSDDDTKTRINLINRGIRTWANDNVTRWQELYQTEEIGNISVGSAEFSLPDDFVLLEAVWIGGNRVEVREPQDAKDNGLYVFVTGNKVDGYNLNLGWTVAANDAHIGKAIKVLYYREPTELVKHKDIPEMSDPNYLIAYASAEAMVSDDLNMYSKFTGDAQVFLANMRERNLQMAQGQNDSVFDDLNGGLDE